ncbi:class II aldolase/adducin family protein [Paenibacillus ginsengihumi]|uniref:class II aldolase/adducin family protein n=1 Tax=Paenibacillus ginsengihumi TaxID=431596 RepID=UPI000380EC48|nr:class II aldolase/adducin family protein [Paenibacillus ginsengihumi]
MLKQQLSQAGRYLLEHELAWGTSGNMSARIDEEHMLITASGTFMGDLKANVIIMRNHGVVVFDDHLTEAAMRLETLEMASRMMIQAQAAGIKLNRIPDQVVQSFLEGSTYKPRKRPGGK